MCLIKESDAHFTLSEKVATVEPFVYFICITYCLQWALYLLYLPLMFYTMLFVDIFFSLQRLETLFWPPPPGVFKKIVRECLKLTSEFRLPLYLKRREIVTHHYTKLPQKTPNLQKLGAFLPNFQKFTQVCKLSALGLERESTHQYTKNDEKTPLSLWASSYTINQWVFPRF